MTPPTSWATAPDPANVGALAAGADGAGHPTTVASIVVAVMIVLGGPQLLAVVRRKAARAGRPA
jgi:hypothetical protein